MSGRVLFIQYPPFTPYWVHRDPKRDEPMKRYRCPDCGTGRNAPSRMSPKDVRRFCLPCSEKTGKLVDMVCPSRERSNAKAAKARSERAKRDRERERRRKYYLDDGTDARMILRDVRKLHTWKREGPRAHGVVKELRLDVDDGNRNVPWERFAVFAMRKAAILALQAVRTPRTEANVNSLLTDAACRYFGLKFPDLRAVARNMARLNRAELDYEAAIVACARAAGAKPPVK